MYILNLSGVMAMNEEYKTYGKAIDRKKDDPLPVEVLQDYIRVRNSIIDPGIINTNPKETDPQSYILNPGDIIGETFTMRSRVDMVDFDWTKVHLRLKVLNSEPNIQSGGVVTSDMFSGSLDYMIVELDGSGLPDLSKEVGLSGTMLSQYLSIDLDLFNTNVKNKWTSGDLNKDSGANPILLPNTKYALIITNDTNKQIRLSTSRRTYLYGNLVVYDGVSWSDNIDLDISVKIEWSQKEPLEITGAVSLDTEDYFEIGVSPNAIDDISVIKSEIFDALDTDLAVSGLCTLVSSETSINYRYKRPSTTGLTFNHSGTEGNPGTVILDIYSSHGRYLNIEEFNLLRIDTYAVDKTWLYTDPSYRIYLIDSSGNYSYWDVLKKNINLSHILIPLKEKPHGTSGTLMLDSIQSVRVDIFPSKAFFDDNSVDTILIYLESINLYKLGWEVDTEIGDINVESHDVENVVVEYFSGDNITTVFNLSNPAISPIKIAEIFEDGRWKEYSPILTSETILTFSSAPPTGTENIRVRYAPKYTGGAVTTGKIDIFTNETMNDALEHDSSVGDMSRFRNIGLYVEFSSLTATIPSQIRVTLLTGDATNRGVQEYWDIVDISAIGITLNVEDDIPTTHIQIRLENKDSNPTVNYCDISVIAYIKT